MNSEGVPKLQMFTAKKSRWHTFERYVCAGLALLCLLLFADWTVRPSVLVDAHDGGKVYWLAYLIADKGSVGPFPLALGVVSAAIASVMVLLLSRHAATIASARMLMIACAAGISGFALLGIVQPFAAYAGFLPQSRIAISAAQCVGMALLFVCLAQLTRFCHWFPRPVSLDQFLEWEDHHYQQQQGLFMRRTIPSKTGLGRKAGQFFTKGWFAILNSSAFVWGFAFLGVFFALAEVPSAGFPKFLFVMSVLLLSSAILSVPVQAYEALSYHRKAGAPEDQRKVEWIHAPVYAVLIVVGGCAAAIVFFLPPLHWGWSFAFSEPAPAIFDRIAVGFALSIPMALILAFLVGLFAAVFYRGALDARVALKKVTLWSSVGLMLTFLFLVVERFVVNRLTSELGMASEAGIAIAGGVVGVSFLPVRNMLERGMNLLVERMLPLHDAAAAQRLMRTVTFSDLTGYSALSVSDESQALLLAALLHRHAKEHASKHKGRVVKSLGDGVIMEFEVAREAVRAVQGLHTGFAKASQIVGLTALPLHSGVHTGEVLLARNGDIFGQSVNLAGRLQDVARPGEIVVSHATFVEAALAEGETRPIGSPKLKNIEEPVECFLIVAEH